jgi:hypothetical protein
MGSLREIAGRSCVSSNLGMADWSERDIDRVAAMGSAGRVSPLGVDVFRWLYSQDPYAATRVLAQLSRTIREKHPMPASFADGIAKQAMREFGDQLCPTCAGRKEEVLANGVKVVCPRCEGTGLRRYSNGARLRGAGFDESTNYRAVVHKPLEFAIDTLRHADNVTNAVLNLELERGATAGGREGRGLNDGTDHLAGPAPDRG